jgi:cysteine desulfurase
MNVQMSKRECVYVDANATYPPTEAHYQDVFGILRSVDGNPSSIHALGRDARVAVEDARTAVGKLVGAYADEVIFTSGATEANNMLIQGLIGKHVDLGTTPLILASAVEHPSIIDVLRVFSERGLCKHQLIPVDNFGRVKTEELRAQVANHPALVCVMHGNNEVGAINDVIAICDEIKSIHPMTHVHVDAVQTVGKLDCTELGTSAIDSLAISAHKFGGFKGIGALILKSGLDLNQFMVGGGQERSRRPGTENLPGIVSFGIRAAEVLSGGYDFKGRVLPLARALVSGLQDIEGAKVHSDPDIGLPNTVNFHIDGIRGEDILLNFDLAGIQASSGSACSSGVGRPSPILKAMGCSDEEALNSIRVSFSARRCAEDVAQLMAVLKETICRVQSFGAGIVHEP